VAAETVVQVPTSIEQGRERCGLPQAEERQDCHDDDDQAHDVDDIVHDPLLKVDAPRLTSERAGPFRLPSSPSVI
jgi:hypothetical protein